MKTHNGIYKEIVDLDYLYESLNKAQTNNRWDIDLLEAKEGYVEDIIEGLYHDLKEMAYKPDSYRKYTVFNGVKMRTIDEPSYRDRILHRAIVDKVYKLFENKFIGTSYAVTRRKGQHRAKNKVLEYIKTVHRLFGNIIYVWQADIYHYYESINHEILFNEIKRTIRDKKLLIIWKRIIDSYHSDRKDDIGIPIGAVISQLSANIYLNVLDHYVKETLRCKFYVRYMDDFVIISHDKEWLKDVQTKVTAFLKEKLELDLNSRSKFFQAKQGIDFCGYRIFYNKVLPRKKNVKSAKKRLIKFKKLYFLGKASIEELDSRLQSFYGMMKHATARRSYYSVASVLSDIDKIRDRI